MSAFGLCFSLGSVMPYMVITPRLARLAHPTSRKHHYLRVVPSRTFGSNPNGDDEGSGAQTAPGPGLPSFSSRAPGFARRPLSPLERVSQMLPQESLSKEIWDLRGDGGETQNQTSVDDVEDLDPQKLNGDVVDGSRYQNQTSTDDLDSQNLVDTGSRHQSRAEEGMHSSRTLPTERTLRFGEILLAEYRRKRRLEFQKMFRLEEGAKLMSNWGVIRHEAVEGCHAGTVLRTSLGLPILIRRPSLEEFTLFMKRGPAIAYPKDASAMLMMMDVNEGDSVLESGSGSGAMSLFLSRAVGSKGSVLSAEVRQDHHRRAVLNYERWRSAWRLRTGGEWPDNVKFHHADLITSAPLLAGRGFNSIALDMVNPQLALPTAVPHLHTGGVCAVYQAKGSCQSEDFPVRKRPVHRSPSSGTDRPHSIPREVTEDLQVASASSRP
ncbi:tRNA (adenine(58)-N(1))-methyltransferase, mitochondrial isoform X2 [Trichomycterus rosablanca]|uniref:tRNA (adenine(58)-N(1))-methyltransferase, mitochondrial isoform X2 n=1 Tax=Trichomycterus rosablanca TaxID=2290929 RepID=UPI002F355028